MELCDNTVTPFYRIYYEGVERPVEKIIYTKLLHDIQVSCAFELKHTYGTATIV